jgi:hypothetical protein
MRILGATTIALAIGVTSTALTLIPAAAQDPTATISVSHDLRKTIASQLKARNADELSAIEVPLSVAQQFCPDVAADGTCTPTSLTPDQVDDLIGLLPDTHGNGGNGSGNPHSASSFAPGHAAGPASEAAPGHQDDPQAAAPGQMKKDGDDAAAGSADSQPGNSGNAPGHNK